MKAKIAALKEENTKLKQDQKLLLESLDRRGRLGAMVMENEDTGVSTNTTYSFLHHHTSPPGLQPFDRKPPEVGKLLRVYTEDDLRRENEHLPLNGPCPFDCKCCVF